VGTIYFQKLSNPKDRITCLFYFCCQTVKIPLMYCFIDIKDILFNWILIWILDNDASCEFMLILYEFKIPKYCSGKWRFGNLIHWFRNSLVLAVWSRLLNLGVLIWLTINTAQHHRFGSLVTQLTSIFKLISRKHSS